MASVLKKRARSLATALRSTAKDIVEHKITPGKNRAIQYGRPVCAFGHALVAAAKAENIELDQNVAWNDDGLKDFLNGEYDVELTSSQRGNLTRGSTLISDVNDEVVQDDATVTDPDRLALADQMEVLAKELALAAGEEI